MASFARRQFGSALAVCALALAASGAHGCTSAPAVGGGQPGATDAISDTGLAVADGAADGAGDSAVDADSATSDSGSVDVESDQVDAAADAVAKPIPADTSPLLLQFGAPTLWQKPLATWIAATAAAVGAGKVEPEITALLATPVGIVIGHGTTGAQLTAAQAAKLPAAEVRILDLASGGTTSAYVSADASLRRFRLESDGTIFAPGGRKPASATKGSLYRYPVGGPWQRFETVPGALWLHDACTFGGALYVAGSAATNAEQAVGEHSAALWRSDDGGSFFEQVSKNWNGGVGISELRWLVPVGDALVGLGRKTSANGNVVELPHVAWAGGKALPLAPTHPLKTVSPEAVEPTIDGAFLIGGQDLLAPGDAALLRVGAKGTVGLGPEGLIALDPLGGTLVAAFPWKGQPPGAKLTLMLERLTNGHYRVRALPEAGVGAGADGGGVTLWTGASSVALTAVAYGHGGMVFGAVDGSVWRAPASWKP